MASVQITSEISLKPIEVSHQPVLMELIQRIYPHAYGHYWKDDGVWYLNEQYSLENLTQELQTENSSYYFVSSSNQNIGIFRFLVDCSYPLKPAFKAFKVHRLYLDPKAQGLGIGRILMQYAAQVAFKTAHKLIWLDAMDTHTQAQKFYKYLGYQRADSQQLPFKLLHDKHRKMWYMHKML